MPVKFNEKILEFLICPRTKSKLTYDQKKNILVSANKKYSYPIKNGVPMLFIEDEVE